MATVSAPTNSGYPGESEAIGQREGAGRRAEGNDETAGQVEDKLKVPRAYFTASVVLQH
jgi:hypothetical protein